MNINTVLQATKRNTGGRSTLSKLRQGGKLPAVVYGYNVESIPIVLDYKQMAKAVGAHGQNSIFQLDIEGKQVNAVISEIQRCALKGHVKHLDLLSINMAEELEVDVPITVIGESIGVREGGVLTQPIRELKIKVKPSNMPDTIDIDVTYLAIGDTLSVADLRSKIHFEIVNIDEDTLVTVTPPAAEPDDAIDPTANLAEKTPIATESPEAQA
ncbi:50S ribosomal protein L25/general stress protein Ctc [Lysinibacillus sp. 54212]|uniref:50S ribosomal protein L25/general stress protein Ctc n=1 Tax=Lysinibacillus sp. 54212 TaxID=3119829 RepID=UPI002FC7FDB6